MTSTVPNAVEHADEQQPPITMFGPDFPYAYDDFLAHPAGLGQIPATEHGTEVAVIGGGLSGIVAAYELMKMGLKPVVYEADRIGGRLRTVGFEGQGTQGLTAEMGAMRFPPSSTALQHYIDLVGLETRPFPNPLAETTPSTVVDLKGESHYAETIADLPQVYRDVAAAWNRCLEEGADFTDMNRALRERTCRASARSGHGSSRSSTTRPSTASSATPRRSGPSATARSSARSASAPAAGTPTSPTPSWRSCASSTPRPTTTTGGSWGFAAAAAQAVGA